VTGTHFHDNNMNTIVFFFGKKINGPKKLKMFYIRSDSYNFIISICIRNIFTSILKMVSVTLDVNRRA